MDPSSFKNWEDVSAAVFTKQSLKKSHKVLSSNQGGILNYYP